MVNTPPKNQCAIWGTPAESGQISPFIWQYHSSRAGGPYTIDLLAWNRMEPTAYELKAKLTTWLINQRRSGDQWPTVTAEVLEHVNGQRSLRISERIDRFFLYARSHGLQPGLSIELDHGSFSTIGKMGAWIESRSDDQTIGFLGLLEDAGLISWDRANGDIEITFLGFERLDSLEVGGTNGRQGFVAMWFGAEMSDAYRNGFAAGISTAGFEPFRIDQKEHSNKIDDEIIAEIRKSRFLVADFTCPIIADAGGASHPNSRGGVYYEAGFAQGIGIPVIWTVRGDCLSHVHFDTRQFAHIVWQDPEELKVGLANRITAIIGTS